MNEDDLGLRNLTYARFVEFGRAPTAAEMAVAAGRDRAEVMAGWERLHAEHALVLDLATGDIAMANPFSGIPTAHRVHAAGRWWFGNCAWDAFGICAALHRDGGSRPRARTAANGCGSRCGISVPTTKACSSTAWSPRPAGGRTSSSLEAR